MTETPPEQTPQDTANQETAPEQPQLSAEQWNQFLGNLSAQNQALAAEVQTMRQGQLAQSVAAKEKEIAEMPDKDRADELQKQLDGIRQAGAAAQAQDISQSVWRRRDADAATRLLQLHNMNGNEAELYRGEWDVNWMPRFVASVEHIVKTKGQRPNVNAANNPAE